MPKQVYQSQAEKFIIDVDKDSILNLAQKKGYISFNRDKSRITYKAQGKTYSFVNPEEKVRLQFYFDLLEKYKYPMNAIEFEVEMPDRTPQRYADIVVFTDGSKRYPFIVVECKKDGISDAEFEQAVKQVIANGRVLKAPYAICVAGNTRRAIEVKKWNIKEPSKAIIADIPIRYGEIR